MNSKPVLLNSMSLWRLFYLLNILYPSLLDQINHNPSITTEEYAWEIKGGGLFSRDVLFSLRSPVSVKAGEQVNFTCLKWYINSASKLCMRLHKYFKHNPPYINTRSILNLDTNSPFAFWERVRKENGGVSHHFGEKCWGKIHHLSFFSHLLFIQINEGFLYLVIYYYCKIQDFSGTVKKVYNKSFYGG